MLDRTCLLVYDDFIKFLFLKSLGILPDIFQQIKLNNGPEPLFVVPRSAYQGKVRAFPRMPCFGKNENLIKSRICPAAGSLALDS